MCALSLSLYKYDPSARPQTAGAVIDLDVESWGRNHGGSSCGERARIIEISRRGGILLRWCHIVLYHFMDHIISYISWDHVIAHHNISSHSISSRIKPCHIIHIAIYYINSWSHHIKSYHIIFYIATSPPIISCHLACHHLIACHIVS